MVLTWWDPGAGRGSGVALVPVEVIVSGLSDGTVWALTQQTGCRNTRDKCTFNTNHTQQMSSEVTAFSLTSATTAGQSEGFPQTQGQRDRLALQESALQMNTTLPF